MTREQRMLVEIPVSLPSVNVEPEAKRQLGYLKLLIAFYGKIFLNIRLFHILLSKCINYQAKASKLLIISLVQTIYSFLPAPSLSEESKLRIQILMNEQINCCWVGTIPDK